MANESIRAAFERMWQHTVAKIEDEVAGLDNGTKVLVVTTEWDEENEYNKTSHTPKQIYDHVQNGGIVMLKVEETWFYNLYYADEEYTCFFHVDDALMYFLCEVDASCNCNFSETQLASFSILDDLRQMITVDENNIPSMTSQQIYNLVQSGGRVVLKYNDQIYSLASCLEHTAYFNYYDDSYGMYCVEIADNKFYRHDSYIPASTRYVLDQLGPIDEALDGIIAIQKELIGMITFTIDGVEYQAEDGMTWREWCKSEYCNGAFVVVALSEGDYIASQLSGSQGFGVSNNNSGLPVFGLADEKIVDGSTWILVD